MDTVAPNADAVLCDVYIAQPECTEMYYSAYQMIDRHNRMWQAELEIERKLKGVQCLVAPQESG